MILSKIRTIGLIIICLLATVLGGCYLTKEASIAEQEAECFSICTSFYPIYIMALNITRDVPGVKLESIASPDTGCLHGVQLSPTDIKKLEESDVFIINGSGLEEYMQKVLENLPDVKVIDSGCNLQAFPAAQETPESYKELDFVIPKGSDESENTDRTENSKLNPHTWVSIVFAAEQVKTIGEQLAEIDPQNKEKYTQNTESYIARLMELKEKMHQGLAGISNRKIITLNRAFTHFAEEFDLDILTVVQKEAHNEPSAREIADIIELVREHQVKALFIEAQHPDAAAYTIARETGAKVYSLDSATTGSLTADAYITAMERNLLILQEALK